ncbi:hypothetical protein GCM10018779_31990 [Streptomyces griseocarneus]|nr:hypothetical protein GCM10018779_31990 [Streptomyces griseocarneus]
MPTTHSGDADAVQYLDQLRGVTPLPGGDDERERTPSALERQMNLAGEAASRSAQRLIIPVPCRTSPLPRDMGSTLAGSDGMLMGATDSGVRADQRSVDTPLVSHVPSADHRR